MKKLISTIVAAYYATLLLSGAILFMFSFSSDEPNLFGISVSVLLTMYSYDKLSNTTLFRSLTSKSK